jgi:hypothetical protein
VRHPSFSANLYTERTFRSKREPIIRRLAINEEPRSLRRQIGNRSSCRITLLADHKQQTHLHACLAELIGCCDLRRNDPLCVTRSAAIQKLIIFRAAKIRRNRVHVRRKHNIRSHTRQCRIHIKPFAFASARSVCMVRLFDRHPLDAIALASEILMQKLSSQTLVIRSGLNIDELLCKLNWIDGHMIQNTTRQIDIRALEQIHGTINCKG